MSPLETAGLTIFILILFFGVFSILLGFPGTIVIFFASIVYALLTGFDKIGFGIILILAAISIGAELLDFYVGVKGATKYGASRKGVIASLFGAVGGAALLTPFLLGLGTLIGAFIGGFAGVFIVEFIRQSKLKPAMRASYGAVLGRIAGIFAKGCCAIAMIIVVLSAIYS